MGMLSQDFVTDFIMTANDGYAMGWHEANGGNLSYRLKPHEAKFAKKMAKPGNWIGLDSSFHVPALGGDLFMISAAGSHFRTLPMRPKECTGIIEIDSKGTSYRHIWGFKHKGRPTSELPTHLLLHELKKAQSGHDCEVVYHAHPSNAIALSSICSTGKEMTAKLWRSMSEAPIVIPEGIGMLKWMVPGSIELGIATCGLMRHCNAVVWSNHGLIACGDSFERVFGIIHTIEKASEISIKISTLASESPELIEIDSLRKLSKELSLDLDLSGISSISIPKLSGDKPFKPSFGTVSISI